MVAKLHVIAVSKIFNLHNEPEIYVYKDKKIFSYSPQWELEIWWDYSDKIKEIAMNVDKGLLQWIDFYIEEGQEIEARGQNFYIENKKVEVIKRLSEDKYTNIGAVTTKIFNEFLRSREKEEEEVKEYLKEGFEKGLFTSVISDIVEFSHQNELEPGDLNNLDRQIVVRTKIEGYDFIVNFIKNILHSGVAEAVELCEMFMSRVFLLESQNYIKL